MGVKLRNLAYFLGYCWLKVSLRKLRWSVVAYQELTRWHRVCVARSRCCGGQGSAGHALRAACCPSPAPCHRCRSCEHSCKTRVGLGGHCTKSRGEGEQWERLVTVLRCTAEPPDTPRKAMSTVTGGRSGAAPSWRLWIASFPRRPFWALPHLTDSKRGWPRSLELCLLSMLDSEDRFVGPEACPCCCQSALPEGQEAWQSFCPNGAVAFPSMLEWSSLPPSLLNRSFRCSDTE